MKQEIYTWTYDKLVFAFLRPMSLSLLGLGLQVCLKR